jgi:hypothetical protein
LTSCGEKSVTPGKRYKLAKETRKAGDNTMHISPFGKELLAELKRKAATKSIGVWTIRMMPEIYRPVWPPRRNLTDKPRRKTIGFT